MPTSEPSKRDRKALGSQIKAALEQSGKPRKWLAGQANCSEKVIRSLIAGEVTRGTTRAKICNALGIDINFDSVPEISDEDHGSYTLACFKEYLGFFHVYRWSFVKRPHIVRSLFRIIWDRKRRCLKFEERQCYDCVDGEVESPLDYSQSGEVFISNSIDLVQLLTKHKGALRLITLSKYRRNNDDDLTMHGFVLTQGKKALHYQPSASPIFFERIDNGVKVDENEKVLVLEPGDPDYQRIYRELVDAQKHIVNVALAIEPQDLLKPINWQDNQKTEKAG